MRGIKSLHTQREVLAKGNIIPFLCRSVVSCCAISQTSSTQSILKIFNINVLLIESAAGLVVNLVNYSMGASRVHERDCGKRRPQRNKKTEADIYGRVIDKPSGTSGSRWPKSQETGGSRTTIHRWRTERGLRWVKIGGFVRVRQSDLDDFLADHRQ